MPVPLSILDLAPIVEGGTAARALRDSADLVQRAEQLGYARFWVAEHHLTPGVASSQPALLLGHLAGVTSTIRLGSGAVQTGHQTALSIVEQFGMLDALHPGRFDLGLGRSGQRRTEALSAAKTAGPPPPKPERVVDGLLLPGAYNPAQLLASERFAVYERLLQQDGAQSADFGVQVKEILDLLAGTFDGGGVEVHAVPGEGAAVQVWLLGSSAGQSARVAGALGLPFTANYHVTPATVLEAVEAYRAAFQPSAVLAEPHVMVSADVVVAPDDAAARELAEPYGLWVRSIRAGGGAVPFPTAATSAAHEWTDEDRALVADRVRTQFVGAPATVAERLSTLQRVTGADELIVTTATHDHGARVRSFELLAKEWYG
ncbi:LLM class flavin-dependent oxidoreductase [Hamadaea tsunoensis]|uniref:LLM class flavin-dependent oxidoreductase n=1 Tax=Hamadaea tsunoensis TaxID=53368 RepID=UPI000417DF92|nr:LLM class flavin-dependent oxidoreductase [Hamadaea tsunoensis]